MITREQRMIEATKVWDGPAFTAEVMMEWGLRRQVPCELGGVKFVVTIEELEDWWARKENQMNLNNSQIVMLTFLKTFGASVISCQTKAGATLSKLESLGLAEPKRMRAYPTRRMGITEKGRHELRQTK